MSTFIIMTNSSLYLRHYKLMLVNFYYTCGAQSVLYIYIYECSLRKCSKSVISVVITMFIFILRRELECNTFKIVRLSYIWEVGKITVLFTKQTPTQTRARVNSGFTAHTCGSKVYNMVFSCHWTPLLDLASPSKVILDYKLLKRRACLQHYCARIYGSK